MGAGTGARAGAATRVRLAGAVCGVAALALAAGCGDAPVRQSTPQDTLQRREAVAAAWEGSAALARWREDQRLGLNPPIVMERAEPPITPLGISGRRTVPLIGHSALTGDVASFNVIAGHGNCDAGVAVDVLEGAGTVVLAGRILVRTDLKPDAKCTGAMRRATVAVTLSRPVGDRILLDAASGEPLEFRDTAD
ncbi:hypothetical protein ACFWBN_20800 [Streptomyces sp. NPDC059989]|uniref:hypothetical protein n=1 Tax=Streptomyces sp. NPDC059989 TaxID=3347026 RepID=UPI0036C8BB00